MTKNCETDYHHPPFDVAITNKVLPNSHLTAVSEVTINIYGFKIQMIRSQLGTVNVSTEIACFKIIYSICIKVIHFL